MTNLGLCEESNVGLPIGKSINISYGIKKKWEKWYGYFNRCWDSIMKNLAAFQNSKRTCP